MVSLIDAEGIYKHIRHFSVGIGSRPKGMKGDKKAADYIYSHFKSLELKVWRQEFEVEAISLDDHKVEITEPVFSEIPSYLILSSPNTSEAGLSGELSGYESRLLFNQCRT